MVIAENNMRDELDNDIENLEAKFEDFVKSLNAFKIKVKKLANSDGIDKSDMWTYHFSNIAGDVDDLTTELYDFGETYNIF